MRRRDIAAVTGRLSSVGNQCQADVNCDIAAAAAAAMRETGAAPRTLLIELAQTMYARQQAKCPVRPRIGGSRD